MKIPLQHPVLHALAAIFLIAGCAPTRSSLRQEVAVRPEPSSVLFVGNSYSFGVPEKLREIASRNGKKLRVGQVTNSGWSLARHARNGETLREIREGNWDVVVLQEHSRIPSLPLTRGHAMFPMVRKLADEAKSHGAVPMLYQTWGYRDGDARHSGGDDFHAMTRRVREGYREAARTAGGLAVVPAGDAWEREISAGRGERLFMPDGSHPTYRGDQLTARVFYQTLFH